jgi:hypothetical protein
MIISRSGSLYESVKSFGPRRKEGLYDGGIQWEGPQSRILEWGGDTRAHWIAPVKAKALHWIDPLTGEDRFSKGHRHPGSHFEPRLILTRGLRHNLSKIIRGVEAQIAWDLERGK